MANVDLVGKKFGRLTVLEKMPKGKGESWWLCECECGNRKVARGSSLKNGAVRSCGCLAKEVAREHGRKMMTKHGFYGTRLYSIFHGMVCRCTNPNDPQYKNYGERGIKVCDEWRHHPEAFCQWATSNGYTDDLTIDRIDCDGDYSPTNCRWVTMREQQTNKRNNVRITYKGETKCVAEWSRELGVPNYLLYHRINAGWTNPQEILFGRKRGIVNG